MPEGTHYVMKEVKNFVCCVALVTTIKIKVKNVARSAKILANVQTFRDCALHQWSPPLL